MAAGFLYVLVNSSMPGLVKIGKTTRTPSERVEELSGVTGVPTPFIVAYEEHFANCDTAEQIVHRKLTEKGMRVSDSREFFRASASEVVKLIMSIPSGPVAPETKAFAKAAVSTEPTTEPWKAVFEEAEDFYYGRGNTFRDHKKALSLYEEAMKLGCLEAGDRLGQMYLYGEGVKRNTTRAIELLMQTALAGDHFGYAHLAIAYCFSGDFKSALKAAKNFVAEGEAAGWGKFQSSRDSHVIAMFEIAHAFVTFGDAQFSKGQLTYIFQPYYVHLMEHCKKQNPFEESPQCGIRRWGSVYQTTRLFQREIKEASLYPSHEERVRAQRGNEKIVARTRETRNSSVTRDKQETREASAKGDGETKQHRPNARLVAGLAIAGQQFYHIQDGEEKISGSFPTPQAAWNHARSMYRLV